MPYIPFTDEQKVMANSVDLEYFLRSRGETLEKVGREYKIIYSDGCGRHDSITMSGSTWFDHKNQTGGGAIKFMQYFYGMSFTDAVQNLLGYTVSPLARNVPETAPEPKKEFNLPPKNKTMNRVYAYLIKQRYIASEVVSFFAKEGKIYEDAEYHNAVFVGFDENGVPRQAHKRSTNSYGKTFRITVEGSDTDYSFAHYGTSGRLYVFEAPIDMLSYITLYPENWQEYSYIAMNGVYESAVLKALEQHDNIEHIVICTDNDEGGIDAYDRLNDLLQERGYTNVTRTYPTYKDFNEDLKAKNGQSPLIAVPHERKQTFYANVDNLGYYPCRPDKLTSQLIDDTTDLDTITSEDYPVMDDLYELCEKEFRSFDPEVKYIYTEDTLQNICLGIYSMCKGAESKYFNGHTNIRSGDFVCFGLFLYNRTAIEYIRNGMKRCRKKESAFILASQNLEDFLQPEIRELTKPLFSIPTHHFLFNPGNIKAEEFIDTLQLEPAEYELIRFPERGTCLYRCGNERYLLVVIAPIYKAALFGTAGGR